MKWITREGKDMFNLQSNSFEIGKGIQEDLDMRLIGDGMSITGFNIMSFNYPQEVQDMITKNASYGMVGDVNRYQQISMTDGMSSGKMNGSGAASDMAGMMMGMNVANQMMNQMNQNQQNQPQRRSKSAESGDGTGKRLGRSG